MSEKLPQSYRVQKACANCRYGYWEYSYSCGWGGPLCTKDGTRPPDPSAGSGECDHLDGESKEFDAAVKTWVAWATPHEIQPEGICDEYEAVNP